jgi:hypothetical protein
MFPSTDTSYGIQDVDPHVILVEKIDIESLFDSSFLVRVRGGDIELDLFAESQLDLMRIGDCRTELMRLGFEGRSSNSEEREKGEENSEFHLVVMGYGKASLTSVE